LSDNNSKGNSCQTKTRKPGRPRRYPQGTSRRVTVRFREGTEHDEILEVLGALPDRATSAWITHALLCYVRGEIRDVEQETAAIEEDLAMDLFGMFEEEEDNDL
jgi:hypothetical protein